MADLTFAKLLATVEMLDALHAQPRQTMFGSDNFLRKATRCSDDLVLGDEPRTVGGLRYHTVPAALAPRRPVLQISPEFEHCSPEFRAAWNAWALERFGTEEVCYVVNERALAAVMRGEFDRMERELICNGIVALRNYT